ncbi:MAG TPA: MFS transporter [Hyphomicrobiaceae bacterium]|nr:MFS transporter [Hyphomicrobiaceae bacterium]
MADWQLWLPPALSKPRFRLYVAGHAVSVIGGWIQQVAIAWLVFRLTNSAFLLGLAGFLLNIFYLLLGPLAGLAADRLPRLKTLIVIDIVLAALSTLLVGLAAAGVETVAAYLGVAALIGAANAFEMPVRQTLIRIIVEERALVTSALGMSAMVFNVGRMVGPAIAGIVLAYLSEAWCFALNALSYAAIIAALLAMRLPPEPAWPAASLGAAQSFSESLQVLFAFPAVRYFLPVCVALGLLATPYVPLMPSIVSHFFDGQSSTLGLLMSSAGIGALASATYLSLQPGYGRQIRLMTIAPLAVGAALALFAWSRNLPLSLLLLAVLGGAALLGVNATNAMLQQSVPDAWRGRVIGLYSMSFAGTAPIGGLIAGYGAERIGLTATLTINGLLIIAAGFASRWRLHNHPEALRGLMRSLTR